MVAKEYRMLINDNFKELQKNIETVSNDSLDIDNEIFSRLDSLGYLKDLNKALNVKLTDIEQTQNKILGALDVLYKNELVTQEKLNFLVNREIERMKPTSKKRRWYTLWLIRT